MVPCIVADAVSCCRRGAAFQPAMLGWSGSSAPRFPRWDTSPHCPCSLWQLPRSCCSRIPTLQSPHPGGYSALGLVCGARLPEMSRVSSCHTWLPVRGMISLGERRSQRQGRGLRSAPGRKGCMHVRSKKSRCSCLCSTQRATSSCFRRWVCAVVMNTTFSAGVYCYFQIWAGTVSHLTWWYSALKLSSDLS